MASECGWSRIFGLNLLPVEFELSSSLVAHNHWGSFELKCCAQGKDTGVPPVSTAGEVPAIPRLSDKRGWRGGHQAFVLASFFKLLSSELRLVTLTGHSGREDLIG